MIARANSDISPSRVLGHWLAAVVREHSRLRRRALDTRCDLRLPYPAVAEGPVEGAKCGQVCTAIRCRQQEQVV